MGFRINTNTAALNSHQAATANNRNLDNSLSKLSSGLRINKAADDASGLAIANALRAQASSLAQAVSNGNDAIGLIQTADGALSEYSNILDTIKTKATQAASDTQNTNSRQAIQKDINKLLENLNTIAKTTSFNGQKLLSGTFTNKEFQMGSNANESIKTSIASAETSKIGLTTRTTLDLASTTGGDVALNVTSALTGKAIQLQKVTIQANNDPLNGMGALADQLNKYSGDTGISAKAVVTTSTAVIQAGTTGADFKINGNPIGTIIVQEGDTSGSLLSAINIKSGQTGISATLNTDGSIKLNSADGRGIKVEGDTAGVLGKSATDLSTVGHLELVQNGASDFTVTNKSAGAVGLSLTVTGATLTQDDSTVAAGSTLASGSILAKDSVLGGDASLAATTFGSDTLVKSGSTIVTGSTLKEGTVLGGDFTINGALTANQDMLLKAGSSIAGGSLLKAGTVVTTAFTDTGSDIHNVGDTLLADVTTGATPLVLASDMIVKKDSNLATASILKAGTFIGADVVTNGTAVTYKDMTMKAGSFTAANSIFKSGSVLGGNATTNLSSVISSEMLLAAGSTMATLSILAAGSTLGAITTTNSTAVLTTDMSISTGSTIETGSIFKAGTTLTQDIPTTAFISGAAYKAGDVLKVDEIIKAGQSILTTADMTMTKGSTLGASSILAKNDGKTGTIALGVTTNSSLSSIDVTTLESAMKAIDTVGAAITNLDTIRSDLGSAQNQITSVINNISVTQVNVKAAESNIRDVDFAAESASFSKYNILAQSGSYAMSQANAVQQNVLKLLQ